MEEQNPSQSNPGVQDQTPDSLQGQALQNQKPNIFKSKFFLGFVAFSILIAFLIGGFMLGRNSVLKELNPTTPSIPPKDPVIFLGTPTLDQTADWKTYSNEKYSIMYPTDFKINGTPSKLNIKNLTGDFDLMITTEPTSLSLNSYIDQKTWCVDIKSSIGKSFTLNQEKSLRFEKNLCGQSGSTDIYSIHSGYAYHLSIPTQETYDDNLSTLDQILSTFKFTQ